MNSDPAKRASRKVKGERESASRTKSASPPDSDPAVKALEEKSELERAASFFFDARGTSDDNRPNPTPLELAALVARCGWHDLEDGPAKAIALLWRCAEEIISSDRKIDQIFARKRILFVEELGSHEGGREILERINALNEKISIRDIYNLLPKSAKNREIKVSIESDQDRKSAPTLNGWDLFIAFMKYYCYAQDVGLIFELMEDPACRALASSPGILDENETPWRPFRDRNILLHIMLQYLRWQNETAESNKKNKPLFALHPLPSSKPS